MVINLVNNGSTIWDTYTNVQLNALAGFGILNGCAISKGTGDWDIDVTAGTVFIDGTGGVSVSAGTVTLTDPANDADMDAGESRIDLITADTSGTLAAVEGTAGTTPDSPDIPSDEVVLGFVVIAESHSTVASSDIIDIPVLINNPVQLIETKTLSGDATADFTKLFGSYDTHVFVLSNVIPASDNVQLHLLTSTDAGANWDTGASDYEYATSRVSSGGTGADAGNGGDTEIDLTLDGVGSAASEYGVSGTVTLYGASLSAQTMVTWDATFVNDGGNLLRIMGGGQRLAAEDVTGVRLLFSSGNLESGTIEHLGVV